MQAKVVVAAGLWGVRPASPQSSVPKPDSVSCLASRTFSLPRIDLAGLSATRRKGRKGSPESPLRCSSRHLAVKTYHTPLLFPVRTDYL